MWLGLLNSHCLTLNILGSTCFWQSTYTLEFLLTRAHVHSSILSLRKGHFGYLHAYLYIFLNARLYIQGPSWSDQFLLTYLEDSYQMAVVCALYEAPGDTVMNQTATWDLHSSGNDYDEIFTLANVWMQVGRRTVKRKGAVKVCRCGSRYVDSKTEKRYTCGDDIWHAVWGASRIRRMSKWRCV